MNNGKLYNDSAILTYYPDLRIISNFAAGILKMSLLFEGESLLEIYSNQCFE